MKEGTALGITIASGCSHTAIESLRKEGVEVDEKGIPHPWYEVTTQRGGQILELMLKHGRQPRIKSYAN